MQDMQRHMLFLLLGKDAEADSHLVLDLKRGK